MRGRLRCLLLPLSLVFWGIAGSASGTGNEPSSLQLLPGLQQGQAAAKVPQQPPGIATLHDIRGPVLLPDSSGLISWSLIALAVLILAGLLLYFWKRRQKGEQTLPDPQAMALSELIRLRQMMNAEQALLYAAGLSEILRRYIEKKFLIHSTAQTTREFFAGLTGNPQALPIMAKYHDRLQDCLSQCDMAKFAHRIPEQPQMEAMEQAVQSFIEATGPSVVVKGEG